MCDLLLIPKPKHYKPLYSLFKPTDLTIKCTMEENKREFSMESLPALPHLCFIGIRGDYI